MTKASYQPEVDGLRAFAIISVLLFHFEIAPFGGGYVGVDVFFVISGYLITRLIKSEVDAGTFSFANFYTRRVRRLFPALIVTVIIVLILAGLFFTPAHFARVGRSAIYTITSLSNVFFWLEAGYFDASANFKPLLHAWSLSVEEQFYIFWPITFYLLYIKARTPTVIYFILGSIVASIAITQISIESINTVFYLTPFRIAEFGIGALLVWLRPIMPPFNLAKEVCVVSGLTLIGLSIIAYDTNTAFPGITALPPCLGAAFVVLGGDAKYSGRIVSNKLCVFIGLISYSLYLIHWPIYVFIKYTLLNDLNNAEKFAAIFISIIIAILMYYFVEKPFRIKRTEQPPLGALKFLLICTATAFVVVFFSAHVWASKGWAWRLPEDIRTAVRCMESRGDVTWKYVTSQYNKAPFIPNKTSVLIVGDSHGKDFFNAMFLNRALMQDLDFRYSRLDAHCMYAVKEMSGGEQLNGIVQERCNELAIKLNESAHLKSADIVVISNRWNMDSISNLGEFKKFVGNHSKANLVVLGRTVEFDDVPQSLLKFGSVVGFEEFLPSRRSREIDEINRALIDKSNQLGVLYIDRYPLVCDEDFQKCDVIDDIGNIVIRDYGHWTMTGSEYIGRKAVALGYGDKVLQGLEAPSPTN